MLLVAGNRVVRTGGIDTFQENVVIGVACDFETASRGGHVGTDLDELQQSLPHSLLNPQFRPGQHMHIFVQDRPGYVETRWSGDCEKITVRRSPVGFRAAEINTFVSITRRKGNTTALASATGQP